MAEMTEKQAAWAVDLANQFGFTNFDEAKAVLSFVRGGAPVDDMSTFTQLRNANSRLQQRGAVTSSEEKTAIVSGRVERMKMETITRPQKDRLLAFITAWEDLDKSSVSERRVELVNGLLSDIDEGLIGGLNKFDASALVGRVFATADLLGIVMNPVDGADEDSDDFATDVAETLTTIGGETVTSSDIDSEDDGSF